MNHPRRFRKPGKLVAHATPSLAYSLRRKQRKHHSEQNSAQPCSPQSRFSQSSCHTHQRCSSKPLTSSNWHDPPVHRGSPRTFSRNFKATRLSLQDFAEFFPMLSRHQKISNVTAIDRSRGALPELQPSGNDVSVSKSWCLSTIIALQRRTKNCDEASSNESQLFETTSSCAKTQSSGD